MTTFRRKEANANASAAEKWGIEWQIDHVKPDLEKVKIQSICYDASEGKEIFISAEDHANKVLLGYLRLRVPSAEGS